MISDMSKAPFSVKSWLMVTAAIFAVCALVRVELRYLRYTNDPIVHSTYSPIISSAVVLFEHCSACLGLTAFFANIFTIILWSADTTQWQLSLKEWLVSILAAAVLNLLSIYLFESSKSDQSVYGGLPRGHIQLDQVISGMAGVIMFILFCVLWWLAHQQNFCKQANARKAHS